MSKKPKEPPRGRPLLAVFYDKEKRPYRAAHYARIDTALPRLTYHVLHLASPGDVVELSHVVTGMQLGTITVHAGGRLETTYVWEE